MDPHLPAATGPTLTLLALTLGYLGWVALSRWWWPFTTCHRCTGTGMRLGLGRRIGNFLRRTHREGTRT